MIASMLPDRLCELLDNPACEAVLEAWERLAFSAFWWLP